jgi:hypothetical protein
MLWRVELNFGTAQVARWVVVADGFASRSDAEWYVAKWKQTHDVVKDSIFRYQGYQPCPT